VLRDLKNKTKKGSNNVSMRDACFHPKYRRATWVAFFVCFFQQ